MHGRTLDGIFQMITRKDIHLNLDTRQTSEILANLPHYGNKIGEGFEHACYYHAYVSVALIIKPKSVLEVGVRLGYSLVSMLRGFSKIENIVGIDTETWVPESQRLAKENLCAAGYSGSLQLPSVSSRGYAAKLKDFGTFDIVHIDGDHSYYGALLDMLEYWPLVRAGGGVMIVDDLQRFDVMRAVVDAVPKLDFVDSNFYFPTGTGWRVFVKK